MTSKTVIRHYCDFCRRGMFKKPAMLQHETTCTLNPKRACWLCECPVETHNYKAIGDEAKKRPDVVYYDDDDDNKTHWRVTSEEAIDWVFNKVDGCPACVLSILRQGNIFAFDHFNYKEAVNEWHKERTIETHGALFRTHD
ncbi:MAG TPA: hypothetical protein VFU31_30465 [Candidatus Binatia bacterium]|nr:hypothetical protein [Candidatus Binatia bacterium]